MVREYAKIYTSIRDDPDFRRLSASAQALYFQLLIGGKLSKCGSDDWRPRRLAPLFGGATPRDVEKWGRELAEARFLLLDEDTEEVLLRTYIRYDGILKSPNMVKAMVAAWRDLGSPSLQRAVLVEVQRTVASGSDLKGLPELPEHFLEPLADEPETLPDDPAPPPAVEPPSSSLALASPPVPSSTQPDRFDEFWAAYPKRGQHQNPRKTAKDKWVRVIKTVDPQVLIDAAAAYAKTRAEEDPRFTAQAVVWLNQERWNDKLEEPARLPRTSSDARGWMR